MKICPSCNAQNTDEATVCYYCNTVLPYAAAQSAELPLTQPYEAAQPYAQPYEAAQPYAQPYEAAQPYAQPYEAAQPYAQPYEAAQSYAPAQSYTPPQGGFTPASTENKPKNPVKVIIPVAAAVVLLFVVLVATHVICIFHDYSWKVKTPATLISAGKEVRACTH